MEERDRVAASALHAGAGCTVTHVADSDSASPDLQVRIITGFERSAVVLFRETLAFTCTIHGQSIGGCTHACL